jgi:hypothetical protein
LKFRNFEKNKKIWKNYVKKLDEILRTLEDETTNMNLKTRSAEMKKMKQINWRSLARLRNTREIDLVAQASTNNAQI